MTRVIDALAESFGVGPVCTELSVPVSTHYARKHREAHPSARMLRDDELVHFPTHGLPRRWSTG